MVRKRLMAWFLAVFVVGIASPSLLKAEVSEPIREAAQIIHDIDHNDSIWGHSAQDRHTGRGREWPFNYGSLADRSKCRCHSSLLSQ